MKNLNSLLWYTIVIAITLAGCKKEPNNTTGECGSTTVTDADGNTYGVVKIGTQCWMSSNLKTTKLRNGTPIPKVTDGWDWWHLGSAAYCDYDNAPANGNTYGRLYNWYAVSSGELCPAGWHVPTQAEWVTLENNLGGASVAGGKLKETGTAHWQSPNEAATNQTGFTALPGGYRSSTGSFFSLTYNGYYWMADEGSDTAYARYHFLDYSLGGVYGTEDYKVDGLSVRCVKD